MAIIGTTEVYTTYTQPITNTKVYSPSFQPSDPTVDWYGEQITMTIKYTGELNIHWGIETWNGSDWTASEDDTVYYRTTNLFSATETIQTLQHTVDQFIIPKGNSVRFWAVQYLVFGQSSYSPFAIAASNNLGTGTWSAYLTADPFVTATPTNPVEQLVVIDQTPILQADLSPIAGATSLQYEIEMWNMNSNTRIGRTSILTVNGTQLANLNIALEYSAANFSPQYTSLSSGPAITYGWRIRLRGNQGAQTVVGEWSPYATLIYDLEGHKPNIDYFSASIGGSSTLVISITVKFSDDLDHDISKVTFLVGGARTIKNISPGATSSNATYYYGTDSFNAPGPFGGGGSSGSGSASQPKDVTVIVECDAGYSNSSTLAVVKERISIGVEPPILPQGQITSLNPTFTAHFVVNDQHLYDIGSYTEVRGTREPSEYTLQDYQDDVQARADSLAMAGYRIQVLKGGLVIGESGEIVSSDWNILVDYTPSNFFFKYTPLEFGQAYTWRISVQNAWTWSDFQSFNFSLASYAPAVQITAPLSGGFDLTPQLVATYTDTLGYSRDETEWSMYDGSTLIGRTLTGTNTLTPTYDGSPTTWEIYTALEYGRTYTVRMRAKSSVNVWSSTATRTFQVGAYTPIATITAPPAKVDDLTPTISGTYSSAIGNTKEEHVFQIYAADGTTLLGEKEIVANTSPFTADYVDDATWIPYNALQWGTQYVALVLVRDEEDIWSPSGVSSPGRRVFRTNNYPYAPINLSPNGETVTTQMPTLTAQFTDPDAGDTPSVMEVELRDANDGTLMFQRTESDNDELFEVLLSDDLLVDKTYMWRTRFQDQGGLQGPWSVWATFSTVEGAAVELTNPEPGDVLDTPLQTFTWTYSHPSVVPQGSGRLRIYAQTGNIPIYDTGVVAGSFTEQLVPLTLLNNETTYRVRVDVTDTDGNPATTGIQFFTTFWEGPDQPEHISATPMHSEGYVHIEWDESLVNPFESYRLYKKDAAQDDTWVFITEIFDVEQNEYDYYFAPSGREYLFSVTVMGLEDGVSLESTISNYVSTLLDFSTDTWINDAISPETYKLKLQRNPTRSSSMQRQSVLTQAIGRKHPALHLGKSYNEQVDTTFQILLPYADIDMLEDIIERGSNVLYRDGRGRRVWIALTGYKLSDKLPNKGELSLQVSVIGVKDR